MTATFLFIFAILAILLTAWLIVIPAGLVAGTFRAFRHGDRKWVRRR